MRIEKLPSLKENYRIRIVVIYGLAAFTFFLAGVVAFVFNSVTLPGRIGPATFNGLAAHVVGSFSFLLSAWWVSSILKEHVVRYAKKSPFMGALLLVIALLAIKYG